MSEYLFTSESVTEGHPDKLCDQVSDGILDALIKGDKGSRVACETLTKTGFVMVAGEVTSSAQIDIPKIGHTYNIVQGTNTSDLESGPGHYPTTGLPGMGETARCGNAGGPNLAAINSSADATSLARLCNLASGLTATATGAGVTGRWRGDNEAGGRVSDTVG